MGFKGSVKSFSLADVLQNVATNHLTGTLHILSNTGLEKFIHFEQGQIRQLCEKHGKPMVEPAIFYARGLVQQGPLENAVLVQKQSRQPLGACLIQLGFITAEQLNEVNTRQISEQLYDLFDWDKATFEFSDGAPPKGLFSEAPPELPALPVTHLIMEAARRSDEWPRLNQAIPSDQEIYHVPAAARQTVETQKMASPSSEKRIAELLDGSRSVADLIRESRLSRYEVYSLLAQFLSENLIQPSTLTDLIEAEQRCAQASAPRCYGYR